MSSSNGEEESERPSNKVARLIAEYELTDIATELEYAWEATGDAHRSLRDLADDFNKRLLEQYLTETGQQTLEREIETLYTLLTADDVSEGDRIRVRRQLEQQGINVDQLVDEFVSYQTMRRYLKDYRGATYTPEKKDQIKTELQNLQQLRGRVGTVTEGKLRNLQKTSRISLGEFRVTIDVRVYCKDCETQYSASELLNRGGCECE